MYMYILVTRNTVDITGGTPIAIKSQSISGVVAVNHLVAFYDIYERKGVRLSFCSAKSPYGMILKMMNWQ
jgi:hypothetical protein